MRHARLDERIADLAALHGLTADEAQVVRQVVMRGHLSTVTPDLYAPRIASALRALKASSAAMVGGDASRPPSPSELLAKKRLSVKKEKRGKVAA